MREHPDSSLDNDDDNWRLMTFKGGQVTGEIERVVDHMLDTGILFEAGGVLGIGEAGEREFGRRHFKALMSVFTSPPLFQVLHGREDLGQVDALSFAGGTGRGASRWRGGGPMVGFRFCQSMRDVLTSDGERDWWSRRSREAMARIRDEFAWLAADGTTLHRGGGDTDGAEPVWWTFAGTKANASLKAALLGLVTAHRRRRLFAPLPRGVVARRLGAGDRGTAGPATTRHSSRGRSGGHRWPQVLAVPAARDGGQRRAAAHGRPRGDRRGARRPAPINHGMISGEN